jgi:beta-lactamase class C
MNLKLLIFITQVILFQSFPIFSIDESRIRFIDHAIEAFMQQYDIPGVAVAFVDNREGKILCYGIKDKHNNAIVTENTLFEIASLTKVFTTTALALHVLQGNMALSDPISKYLPELNNTFRPVSKITLLELATHTSGLPRTGGDWHNGGPRKIMDFLQKWRPDNPVKKQYAYSNLGFGLLGYALENVEKRPYEKVIKYDILIPLGMNTTFTEVPKEFLPQYSQGYGPQGKPTSKRISGYIPGSGAIRSTAKDLLQFLKANMALSGPAELLKAMQLAQRPYHKVRAHFTMGLGWQRFNTGKTLIIDKNGGLPGFTSYMGWIPEKGIGIVILTNKSEARPTELGRFLLKHFANDQ